MIYDKLENLYSYLTEEESNVIRPFIMSVSVDMEEKFYPLNDDVYARVMSYNTLLENECEIESHKIYTDVQSSIIGCEGIDVFRATDIISSAEYNVDNDTTNHIANIAVARTINLQGMFTMLFPGELHRPKISVINYPFVKKFVIKIKRYA